MLEKPAAAAAATDSLACETLSRFGGRRSGQCATNGGGGGGVVVVVAVAIGRLPQPSPPPAPPTRKADEDDEALALGKLLAPNAARSDASWGSRSSSMGGAACRRKALRTASAHAATSALGCGGRIDEEVGVVVAFALFALFASESLPSLLAVKDMDEASRRGELFRVACACKAEVWRRVVSWTF